MEPFGHCKQISNRCTWLCCISPSLSLSVCRLFVLSTHAYRHAFTATRAHTFTPHKRGQKGERDKGRERAEIESEAFKHIKGNSLVLVCSRCDKRKRMERIDKPTSVPLLVETFPAPQLALAYRSCACCSPAGLNGNKAQLAGSGYSFSRSFFTRLKSLPSR